jgi:hypothetical protein
VRGINEGIEQEMKGIGDEGRTKGERAEEKETIKKMEIKQWKRLELQRV